MIQSWIEASLKLGARNTGIVQSTACLGPLTGQHRNHATNNEQLRLSLLYGTHGSGESNVLHIYISDTLLMVEDDTDTTELPSSGE